MPDLTLTITLTKSDAMMFGSNLNEPAKYERQERTIQVPLPAGPWVQFTYDWFEIQGEHRPEDLPRIFFHEGFWNTSDDNDVWSDLVLSIEPLVQPDLWALTIDHRHGTDTTVYRTEASARDGLVRWVHNWWEYELPDHVMPADPNEAVDEYFERVETEGYLLAPASITD